jgi:hypothetical protein
MALSLTIVFLWVALATFADIRFKLAASIATADFLVGAICYFLTSFLALAAFHRQQWGWTIIVWNCVSLALGMALSVFLFREPFTVKRVAASLFVFLAILLSD